MELYIPPFIEKPMRNAKTGKFLKGFVRKTPPVNKGRKMSEFAPPEVCERIKQNLTYEGRLKGANKNKELFGRRIMAIQNGKIIGRYTCASVAKEQFMKEYGVKLCKQNIISVAKGKRRTHKGIRWFYEDEPHKWEKELINTGDTTCLIK